MYVPHVSLGGVPSIDSLAQNKNKEKKGKLPEEMMSNNRYLAARTVEDVWICYPWEATNIDEHDEMAKKQPSF